MCVYTDFAWKGQILCFAEIEVNFFVCTVRFAFLHRLVNMHLFYRVLLYCSEN